MRPLSQCLRVLGKTAKPLLNTKAKSAGSTATVRSLATVSPSPPRHLQTSTAFSDALDAGPTLSDFLTSPPEEPLSIPGTSHLPEWLKRPIPAGGSFAKIKQDLRGLKLHTGSSHTPGEDVDSVSM